MAVANVERQVPNGLSEQEPPLISDPVEAARSAGLRYYTDATPGIRRKRAGKRFTYLDVEGNIIRDKKELARIKAIGIPPAWTDVWICPSPRGHIQATGRDARGRKQYRYHQRWREVRDETKYNRMIAFAEALPLIREQTDRDLSLHCLSREKVLALVVQLLDMTAIRIGNEEYARENRSFGLTTLRTRHVSVSGTTIHFHFRAKSGKEREVDVSDPRLARAVKRCKDLPGYELFQYRDEGERHTVDSADINDYIRALTGENFTAKDFRTWHGTVHAACALYELGPAESEAQARQNVNAAVAAAAQFLGNTPAICRKSYIHPAVLEAYEDGTLFTIWDQVVEQSNSGATHDLATEEAAVLAVLQQEVNRAA